MKRKTVKKLLLGTGIILIVLLIGGYFAMNYAVNRMIHIMAEGIDIDSLNREMQGVGNVRMDEKNGVTAPAGGSGNVAGSGDAGTSANAVIANGSTSASGASASPNNDSSSNGGGNSQQSSGGAAQQGAAASQAPVQSSAPSKSDKLTYSPEISTDKAKQVEDQITLKDKAFITSVIMKRFSSSELNLFGQMASGGLSVEEKKEAKKVFLEKLSESEYNQLIAIATKLGLSQGKDYQNSLKENLN